MSNCFQLTRKGATEPSTLVEVDNAICANFGVEPGDDWFCNWYNSIGLALACGRTFDQIRADCRYVDTDEAYIRAHYMMLTRIATFLEQNYDVYAWAER